MLDKIRAIELFNRIAELKSFARAADCLGLSHPVASRLISELEKELGVQFPVSLNPTKNVEEKTDSTTTDPCQNQTDTNKVEWNWM